MQNHEAEALLWISFDALERLDLQMDRLAVAEYLRVYATATARSKAQRGLDM